MLNQIVSIKPIYNLSFPIQVLLDAHSVLKGYVYNLYICTYMDH